MDETPGITNLGDGKYSFFVGRQRYTLTTPLSEERFTRIVLAVQSLVSSFPQNLSQDDRLFLALMSLGNELDETRERLESIATDNRRKDSAY